MLYDLAIVGGGPAGVAAGVYAARKKLKTVLITDNFGGQSLVSADVQNWIGTRSISGFDLARQLEDHLRAQEDIEVIDGDIVAKIEKSASGFKLTTRGDKAIETRSVLVATGSRYRKLNIPGESEFEGKGVSNCSTCDAPVFKGKDVAVVGGGNAGLEAVLDLLPYAKNIYIFETTNSLKGDQITQDKIKADSKAKVILNAEAEEIIGGNTVEKLRYRDKTSGISKKVMVQGVFVKIGLVPSSDIDKGLVRLNGGGEIIVDHKTQETSSEGIWAAGDVSDVLYKQNNVSAGDAIKAVLNIYEYLQKN